MATTLYYALSGVQDGARPAYRQISDPSQIDPATETLYTCDTWPTDPIWDGTLNGGAGAVREMTDTEIAQYNAMEAAASQQTADRATVSAFLSGGSDQSTTALTTTLQALLRLSGF